MISGMSTNAEPEIVSMLTDRGLDTAPRTTVDAPQTLVAMVRSGVGIGIANAVALDNTDTSGVVLLGFDDPEMIREVAAYWYDELLVSEVGRSLHRRCSVRRCPAERSPCPVAAIARTDGLGHAPTSIQDAASIGVQRRQPSRLDRRTG